MNLTELKTALEKAKRQLAAAGAQDEKDHAQKKIAKLESEIEHDAASGTGFRKAYEEGREKQKAEEAKKKPSSKPKAEKKSEPKGDYKKIDGHPYKKVSETEYVVKHKSDSKKVAAIVFKDDKWAIDCCDIKKYPTFKKDEGMKAVEWMVAFWDCMDGTEAKEENKEAQKKRRTKRANAGKPAELSVTEIVKKTEKTVESKLDKKIKEGKQLNKKEVASSVVSSMKISKTLINGSKMRDGAKKRLIKRIDEILRFLSAKQYATGGTVEIEPSVVAQPKKSTMSDEARKAFGEKMRALKLAKK